MKTLKKIKPSKYICLLFLIIPIILGIYVNTFVNNDIWFILNHGRYVLENGFPYIEPFTIHEGFSFVMQQWLSAVIFYLSYYLFGKYGLFILVQIINLIIIFLLYKLCMLLSNNKYRLSILITCITDVLLIAFMVTRPQIFTYLMLLLVIYIMEVFVRNKKTKLIYFLPLISFLQINLHASMWFMIFIFLLPYLAYFIYLFFKKKDKSLFKILLIMGIMFLCGFINPYGIKAITYIFTSYGNSYINDLISEMRPLWVLLVNFNLSGIFILLVSIIICLIYIIINKKGNLFSAHILFLIGLLVLNSLAIRNFPIFVIGTVPFLAYFLKDFFSNDKPAKMSKFMKKTYAIIALVLLITISYSAYNFNFESGYEEGIEAILEDASKEDIVLYTGYDVGGYAEFRGIKVYLDPRAEVFLKANNNQEDILKEYVLVNAGNISYEEFIDKYNFTHMFILKREGLYKYALEDDDYEIIYENYKYAIFKRV